MKNMFIRIHITLILLCASLQGQEVVSRTLSIGTGKVVIESLATVTKADLDGELPRDDVKSIDKGDTVTIKCKVFWVKEDGAAQKEILEIIGKYVFSFNGVPEQRFSSGVWDVREVENGFEILFVKEATVYRQKFWPELPTAQSSIAQPVCSLLVGYGKGVDSLEFTDEGGILLK